MVGVLLAQIHRLSRALKLCMQHVYLDYTFQRVNKARGPRGSKSVLLKAYIYRLLLKADHVPGDTWGSAIFGPRGMI